MIFPNAEPVPTRRGLYETASNAVRQPSARLCVPRHPSKLYEMLLEGVVLFCVMFALSRRASIRARFGLSDRRVPGRLWPRAHHRGVLPPAGCLSWLPDRRGDDGAVAVDPDADRGGVADPAHAVMERLDRFMARANAAYYATHDPFRDFTTSPEITQVFGEILGLWAAVTWELIGRPDPVLLVECGPGRGTLMADALRADRRSVAPAFGAALRVHLVETSPRLRALQAERLPGAVWHDRLETVPAGRCCCWRTSSSMRCRYGSSCGARQDGWSGLSTEGRFVEVAVSPRLLSEAGPLPLWHAGPLPLPLPPGEGECSACRSSPSPCGRGRGGGGRRAQRHHSQRHNPRTE